VTISTNRKNSHMTTLPNSCTVFVRVMSQLNNVCALQSFLAHIATLIKIPFIKVFFRPVVASSVGTQHI